MMLPVFQTLQNENVGLAESLLVILIGVFVVFLVLAVLIGFIELMHRLLNMKKAPAQTEKPVIKENTERISAGVMAEVPDAANAAEDGEFLAAVSTAISVATGKPNGSFVIKSIKNA